MKRAVALPSLLIASLAGAQAPFDSLPIWTSTDISNISTGAAWADIDRDGWLDLVVSNGNDIARQHVVLYRNNGSGSLEPAPRWESSDSDYHGHLAVGDVNNDGWPDVAVSVFMGGNSQPEGEKGKVKLYLNERGTLSATPAWESGDSLYTFSCAFGDADGDGDLDLAVAGGGLSRTSIEQDRIYYSHAGRLDRLPAWKSRDPGNSWDIVWADFDNDGRLDLVFGGPGTTNRIYRNFGDSIGTVAHWSSTDRRAANSLFVGDVNNDGDLDLAVSDNTFSGQGRYKVYANNAGTLDATPFWTSSWSGQGSGIALADLDGDGRNDLITGGWWDRCRIYINQGGTFTASPQWNSEFDSVVEAIVCGDYDNDGLDTLNVRFTGDGARRLFYVGRSPLQRPPTVRVGSNTLAQDAYCFDLENAWISLQAAPGKGQNVSIRAIASRDLDFAVSEWSPSRGNYVFKNTSSRPLVHGEACGQGEIMLTQNYPNPFKLRTTIRFRISRAALGVPDRRAAQVSLRVYDVSGTEVETILDEPEEPGEYQVTYVASALPSGVYWYRLQRGSCVATRRLVILR